MLDDIVMPTYNVFEDWLRNEFMRGVICELHLREFVKDEDYLAHVMEEKETFDNSIIAMNELIPCGIDPGCYSKSFVQTVAHHIRFRRREKEERKQKPNKKKKFFQFCSLGDSYVI